MVINQMHYRTPRIGLCALLALGLLAIASAARGQLVFSPMALTGQQAPGGQPGETFFNDLEDDLGTAPGIDADGAVAFAAFLSGEGLSVNEQAMWLEQAGELVMVMRNGDPAPGAPGFAFITSGLFALSPRTAGGAVAFRGIVTPGLGLPPAAGIWTDAPGPLSLVVLGGTQAPGLPSGVRFPALGVGQPILNTLGHTLFASPLEGPGINADNNESIWSDRTGKLELVVREGDDAPGTNAVFGTANSIFAPRALRAVSFNSESQAALHGNLTGSGIDDFNDEAVWVEASNTLSLLVREGDPAPGFGSNVRIASGNGADCFLGLTLNANGAVLFGSRMTGLPEEIIPPSTLAGLWSTRTGELAVVAHYGQQPPGEPDDSFFVGFGQFAFDDLDQAAFIAILPGPLVDGDFQDFGICWESTGELAMLVRDGTQVPGFPEGVVFGTTAASNALAYQLFSFSANGHLLFTSFLTGPGIDGSNNFALFLATPAGGIQSVVREGDLFDVHQDGTDLRAVVDILPGNVSADGTVIFKLLFVDGTIGIFTAAPFPAPPGDMSCDGVVDLNDVIVFVSALIDPINFDDCDILRGDMNSDGAVDGLDVQGFVSVIIGS